MSCILLFLSMLHWLAISGGVNPTTEPWPSVAISITSSNHSISIIIAHWLREREIWTQTTICITFPILFHNHPRSSTSSFRLHIDSYSSIGILIQHFPLAAEYLRYLAFRARHRGRGYAQPIVEICCPFRIMWPVAATSHSVSEYEETLQVGGGFCNQQERGGGHGILQQLDGIHITFEISSEN